MGIRYKCSHSIKITNLSLKRRHGGCIRQWPHFRSRVSKLKREEGYDVYVDIVNENEDDIDSMLILLSSMMIINCSTCEWRKRIFVAARAVDNWVSFGKRRRLYHEGFWVMIVMFKTNPKT